MVRLRLEQTRSVASCEARFNLQRLMLNAQRPIQKVGRWLLGIGRWTFAFSGHDKSSAD
jgi:hypothetical protein